MINFKKEVVNLIDKLNIGLTREEIFGLIENPPNSEMGDYAFPCFKLAKEMKKAPNVISQELCEKIEKNNYFHSIKNLGPYINFYVNNNLMADLVLNDILLKKYDYGKENNTKNIVIDFSSTNIAKPFHIGHIRSTVIGNVIRNLYKFLGYNTTGINYLGDYGTQFGKMIAAYKLWGNDEIINKDPINELLKLYVEFNKKSKDDEDLLNLGREYFNKLENKDEESVKLWSWFKEISLKEFQKVYDKLDIKFDSYNGEAYNSQFIDEVLEELESKKLLVESDGCKVVNLDKYNLPPAIILKSNGSSTYITRDIATAKNRMKEYSFNKNIYVVAIQQKLHFQQLKAVLSEMGYSWADDCIHVSFGMVSVKDDILGKSAKLSTRDGNVIFLNDVLEKSVEKTMKIINDRNPNLENKEDVAKNVGIGAVVFQELFNTRIKDYTFDWDNLLNFDGETGPYMQYTVARANSILEKNNFNNTNTILNTKILENYNLNDDEINLIKLFYKFNSIVSEAAEKYEPSILTRYITELSKNFNKFYNSSPINNQKDDIKNIRLIITFSTKVLIESGLNILGIKSPRKM